MVSSNLNPVVSLCSCPAAHHRFWGPWQTKLNIFLFVCLFFKTNETKLSSLPENMQGHQDLKQRAGNSLGGHAVEAQNLKKCEQLKAWSAKPTLGALLFHIYNLFSRPMVEKFFAYPKIVEFRNSKNIIAHSLSLQFLRAVLDAILAYSSRPCQLVCCTIHPTCCCWKSGHFFQFKSVFERTFLPSNNLCLGWVEGSKYFKYPYMRVQTSDPTLDMYFSWTHRLKQV